MEFGYDESLVPPSDWVEFRGPYALPSKSPCPSCSAQVADRAVHRQYHIDILERANRYVSPPVYG